MRIDVRVRSTPNAATLFWGVPTFCPTLVVQTVSNPKNTALTVSEVCPKLTVSAVPVGTSASADQGPIPKSSPSRQSWPPLGLVVAPRRQLRPKTVGGGDARHQRQTNCGEYRPIVSRKSRLHVQTPKARLPGADVPIGPPQATVQAESQDPSPGSTTVSPGRAGSAPTPISISPSMPPSPVCRTCFRKRLTCDKPPFGGPFGDSNGIRRLSKKAGAAFDADSRIFHLAPT